ncbi:MAG: hypothetical protein R3E12_06875 [Candidatus Eisenbacteria bacterium]
MAAGNHAEGDRVRPIRGELGHGRVEVLAEDEDANLVTAAAEHGSDAGDAERNREAEDVFDEGYAHRCFL